MVNWISDDYARDRHSNGLSDRPRALIEDFGVVPQVRKVPMHLIERPKAYAMLPAYLTDAVDDLLEAKRDASGREYSRKEMGDALEAWLNDGLTLMLNSAANGWPVFIAPFKPPEESDMEPESERWEYSDYRFDLRRGA